MHSRIKKTVHRDCFDVYIIFLVVHLRHDHFVTTDPK